VKIDPMTGALGAEISDVDLSAPMDDDLFSAIKAVFLDYQVVFFPNQNLTTTQHRDFASRFGSLDIPVFVPPFDTPKVEGHPEIYQLIKEPADSSINIGGFWHADVTHRETPNLASIAYVREAPEFGGDTLFSNLYLAYETLSPGLQNMLRGMRAIHTSAMPYGGKTARSAALSRDHVKQTGEFDFEMDNVEEKLIETAHPVIRQHPDTGRLSLYVNRAFTSHFENWTPEESKPLLEFLWEHAERPEFTCRYRWRQGSVGIWDNRCVLHYALNDYYGQRRVLHRISVNEANRPTA